MAKPTLEEMNDMLNIGEDEADHNMGHEPMGLDERFRASYLSNNVIGNTDPVDIYTITKTIPSYTAEGEEEHLVKGSLFIISGQVMQPQFNEEGKQIYAPPMTIIEELYNHEMTLKKVNTYDMIEYFEKVMTTVLSMDTKAMRKAEEARNGKDK